MINSSSLSSSSVSNIKPIYIILFIIIITPLIFTTTFTLTILLGHGHGRTVPYISDTIDFSPESCIGSFGLSIVAFLSVLIVLIKHLILKNNIVECYKPDNIPPTSYMYISNMSNNKKEKSRKIKFIVNRFSTTMGIISGICIHGVASFQYHNTNLVHQLFSAMFFFTGFLYMVTQTFLDDKFSNLPKRISRIRKFLIVIGCSFIGYIIIQFYIDNLAAIFEITSALSIFIYNATFIYEFSKINLNLELQNRQVMISESTSLLHAQQ